MNQEEFELKIQQTKDYILNEAFDNFNENHKNNIINYFLETASTIDDDEQCAIFIREIATNILSQKIEQNSLREILKENNLWIDILKRTRKYIL